MSHGTPKPDIVDRLLDWNEIANRNICTDDGGCFRCEAAEEIRFLREELRRIKNEISEHKNYILKMQDTDGR